MLGPQDFEQGTQPEEATVLSCEEQGKRLRDALCDVTRPQGLPNRLWVGAKLESRIIYIWPADWNAVSLRRENNTSRTNAVSFFRSGKWKLLIIVAFGGDEQVKAKTD